MKTAVIGAAGQLGSALISKLGKSAIPLTHEHIELTDVANVRSVLESSNANAVINTAAYNFVDRAEDEPEQAFAVNSFGPRNLALSCEDLNIPLLHVSTDYVFGSDLLRTTPYRESDPPGPVSAYGISKLSGEYFVSSLCTKHFIVRSCGLYGHAGRTGAGKGNFVETMLRLGSERDSLSIVDDQLCTPTNCDDLADALIRILATEHYGLYHATNSGQMTWRTFAEEIFRLAGIDVAVTPITTEQFGAKARRPKYSVLSCEKLIDVLGHELPPWQEALKRYLEERNSSPAS